jgi:hypothetical protein
MTSSTISTLSASPAGDPESESSLAAIRCPEAPYDLVGRGYWRSRVAA